MWSFATGGKAWGIPAVGADGTVYFTSYDNKIYALDSWTGDKKWEFATGGQVWTSPAIAPDGSVYFGSNDHKVYAIQGSSGPLESPWAMRGQDARNTGRVKPMPTYALVAGAGDTDNAAFTIDGRDSVEQGLVTGPGIIHDLGHF